MITTNDLHDLQVREKPISLAAGFFDGVHRGHQAVIQHAKETAQKHDGEVWVMTFAPHPMKVLKPIMAPLMITSLEHKLSILETLGVDGTIILPFTKQLAGTSPEDFANWLFHCAPSLHQVVVGENWRFGSRAAGTPDLLAEYGRDAGVSVHTMDPVLYQDDPISSTRIRNAIISGDLDAAKSMLGRPPGILGVVIHGRAVGRKLGFPSANLDPHNEVFPPTGIYAVQARIGNDFYAGACSYGTRPTFDKNTHGATPILELHLIDFEGDLYGQNVEMFILKRLRDEWYFETIEALKKQIAKDVEQTREIVSTHGLSDTQKKHLLNTSRHL